MHEYMYEVGLRAGDFALKPTVFEVSKPSFFGP